MVFLPSGIIYIHENDVYDKNLDDSPRNYAALKNKKRPSDTVDRGKSLSLCERCKCLLQCLVHLKLIKKEKEKKARKLKGKAIINTKFSVSSLLLKKTGRWTRKKAQS